MKKTFIFFVFLLVGFLLVGCSREDSLKIELNKTEINVGETAQATVTGAKEGATITYESSDSAIATVDNNGKITGVAAGDADIKAKADGKEASAKIKVKPLEVLEVTGVSISGQSQMTVGTSQTLSVTLEPAGATTGLSFLSSAPDVATVSSTGKVEALAVGNATITVTTANNKSATLAIEVVAAPVEVESITLDQADQELGIGQTLQLTYALVPAGIAADVSFASDAESVATVSAAGLVTAQAEGSATITVSAGGKSDTVVITVVDDSELTLENLQAKMNAAITTYNSSLNGHLKLSVVTPETSVVTEFAYAYTEDSINELMYKQTGATSIEVYVKSGKIYTNENGSKSKEDLTAANATVLKDQYGVNKLVAEAMKFRNEFAFFNSLTLESEVEGVYTFNLDLETYSGTTFKPAGKESIKLVVEYDATITKLEIQVTNTDLNVSKVTLELLGLEKPTITFPSDLILW